MKLIKSIKRWIIAKDMEASEEIERGHEIQFAKQDLDAIKKDMASVTSNVGTIKSNILKLKREKTEMEAAKDQHEKDAIALIKLGKEGLAERHAGKIEGLEKRIALLEDSIKQQDNLLKIQQRQREKLSTALNEAESSMKMMESMNAVAKSTEKVSQVKLNDTSSALSRFKDRQSRIQERLDRAQSIEETIEESSGTALDRETEEALGRAGGSDVLARLKAKINS